MRLLLVTITLALTGTQFGYMDKLEVSEQFDSNEIPVPSKNQNYRYLTVHENTTLNNTYKNKIKTQLKTLWDKIRECKNKAKTVILLVKDNHDVDAYFRAFVAEYVVHITNTIDEKVTSVYNAYQNNSNENNDDTNLQTTIILAENMLREINQFEIKIQAVLKQAHLSKRDPEYSNTSFTDRVTKDYDTDINVTKTEVLGEQNDMHEEEKAKSTNEMQNKNLDLNKGINDNDYTKEEPDQITETQSLKRQASINRIHKNNNSKLRHNSRFNQSHNNTKQDKGRRTVKHNKNSTKQQSTNEQNNSDQIGQDYKIHGTNKKYDKDLSNNKEMTKSMSHTISSDVSQNDEHDKDDDANVDDYDGNNNNDYDADETENDKNFTSNITDGDGNNSYTSGGKHNKITTVVKDIDELDNTAFQNNEYNHSNIQHRFRIENSRQQISKKVINASNHYNNSKSAHAAENKTILNNSKTITEGDLNQVHPSVNLKLGANMVNTSHSDYEPMQSISLVVGGKHNIVPILSNKATNNSISSGFLNVYSNNIPSKSITDLLLKKNSQGINDRELNSSSNQTHSNSSHKDNYKIQNISETNSRNRIVNRSQNMLDADKPNSSKWNGASGSNENVQTNVSHVAKIIENNHRQEKTSGDQDHFRKIVNEIETPENIAPIKLTITANQKKEKKDTTKRLKHQWSIAKDYSKKINDFMHASYSHLKKRAVDNYKVIIFICLAVSVVLFICLLIWLCVVVCQRYCSNKQTVNEIDELENDCQNVKRSHISYISPSRTRTEKSSRVRDWVLKGGQTGGENDNANNENRINHGPEWTKSFVSLLTDKEINALWQRTSSYDINQSSISPYDSISQLWLQKKRQGS